MLARDEGSACSKVGLDVSNLGISLLVIPIGLLLIVGMVASLFLYVH